MYYYPHHIGDFISDTARLTDSQCMAYLRLIWAYYDTENPLENDCDALAFKIGATSSDVALILKHYFKLEENQWVHDRCEKVITEYHSKADKARNSANARWKNANAMRTHTERNANESLLDANQEPITNNQEKTKDVTPSATPKKSTGCRLADDWKPTKEYWEAAILIKPDLTREWFSEIAHGFKDYWIAKTGKDATKANWLATWRNWLRNEVKKNAGFKQPSGAGRSKEKISHADRVRQEARLELQRIDQEAGHDAVYENGGLVREQSSKSEFDHLF
jgi:uncharacterized protein YdaU (DUF1376 family)